MDKLEHTPAKLQILRLRTFGAPLRMTKSRDADLVALTAF
jgi:hypothetical protein